MLTFTLSYACFFFFLKLCFCNTTFYSVHHLLFLSKFRRCVFVATVFRPATTAAFKVSITTGAARGQTVARYCVAFKQQASQSFSARRFLIELQTSAAWKPELWSLSDVFAFQINRGINPWTGATLLLLERSYLVKNSEQLHIVGAFMSLSCGNLTFRPPLFFLPDKRQQVSQNSKLMVSLTILHISVCCWHLLYEDKNNITCSCI